jgi:hypothetical protein
MVVLIEEVVLLEVSIMVALQMALLMVVLLMDLLHLVGQVISFLYIKTILGFQQVPMFFHPMVEDSQLLVTQQETQPLPILSQVLLVMLKLHMFHQEMLSLQQLMILKEMPPLIGNLMQTKQLLI